MTHSSTLELQDIAARIRTKNLGEVLARKSLPVPGGRLTPFQSNTLAHFRHAGLTGLATQDGAIKGSYLKPAPSGGYTEEWAIIVTPRDVTRHLASQLGT